MQYGLKFIVIGYVVFSSIKVYTGIVDKFSKPYFGGIDGVFDIKEFYWNRQILPPIITDTMRWKKIDINKEDHIAVQYMNDSVGCMGSSG